MLYRLFYIILFSVFGALSLPAADLFEVRYTRETIRGTIKEVTPDYVRVATTAGYDRNCEMSPMSTAQMDFIFNWMEQNKALPGPNASKLSVITSKDIEGKSQSSSITSSYKSRAVKCSMQITNMSVANLTGASALLFFECEELLGSGGKTSKSSKVQVLKQPIPELIQKGQQTMSFTSVPLISESSVQQRTYSNSKSTYGVVSKHEIKFKRATLFILDSSGLVLFRSTL